MTDSTGDTSPSTPSPQDNETPEERAAVLAKVFPALRDIADKLGMIERAMQHRLPKFIDEQPLGDVVDFIAEFKLCMEALHGDGSSVATNRVKAVLAKALEVNVPERFTRDKVKNFSTDKFRATKSQRVLASMVADRKEEAMQWLRDHELGDLIKPTVNASSLAAAAKERMEGGREMDEELFNVHIKDGTSITKLKPSRS